MRYPGEEKALGKVSRVGYKKLYTEDGDQQFPSSLKLNKNKLGLNCCVKVMTS